ncbi:3-oxoacyl-[acyl-carrier-protein] synthase-3 [Streptoalloteichus tenebrarius]|uniref:Beta-ketoacyl-[acyl-carrier-protein] synthase III n=1 Tax=Streptoalloteichus tenebrarius (strain ATCC 17920 / DSM 40477 / JCM 4838 / CBS 697.72 / NBRC 16177 / NCIMB 11028 / NRRL B-12390 / A12253. 1 / ISP 5477) TaxID=1933 RepID=A0ABT1HMG1_STRSD|nr:beta-ketoacyl-ACP synthase III [Streptoalloteichus tenebrarius]MCP2256696.1 3-oxoacyl-[acyl-carrier-protein] synthase-3 [Streptoalloteichus tenebrarius]BFF00404.1 ketoacyl-ACP synthase III [Streptoalloteichus tenebrarius]
MSRPRLRQNTGPAGTRLLGFGSAQGNRVVTNDDLAQRVDTSDEWIRQRVGIVERRLADPDQTLVDMAVEAGSKALANAGLTPTDVDTVIVATCTMPGQIPNAAAQTADRIGVKAAAAFDLNAACAGFSYALTVASELVRGGTAGRVLVIGAERFTDWIDWDDRANCIIFADGAGAAVVGPSDEPGIGPVAWGSAGDLVDLIYLRDGRYVYQEGRTVFRWATTQIAPIAERAVELAGLALSDIDVLVPHQANLRIVEAIAKRLRAKGAREDLVVANDIVHSGNTSSGSIPMALDHMTSEGRVSSGDVMLLVGFGAGLSYSAQVVVCP